MTNTLRTLATVAAAVLVLAPTAAMARPVPDAPIECGPGTHLSGAVCVADVAGQRHPGPRAI